MFCVFFFLICYRQTVILTQSRHMFDLIPLYLVLSGEAANLNNNSTVFALIQPVIDPQSRNRAIDA